MKVLAKKINEKAKLIDLDCKLKTLQQFVGGYIENPFISEELSEKNILVISNENAILENLPPTLGFADKNTGEILEGFLFGQVLFTSEDDEGNIIGLTDEQIEFIKDRILSEEILLMETGSNREIKIEILLV